MDDEQQLNFELNDEIAQLRDLVDRLRAELREQWLSNHAEHCTNEWPHGPRPNGPCYWPMPDVLSAELPASV